MLLPPPKLLSSLSSQDRDDILISILNQDQIGLMWQEKIRRYICYHNRNLLKASKLRFKNDYLSHLEWMRDIFLLLSQKSLAHNNPKYDSSILNAAFIADDACHGKKSKRQELDFLLQIFFSFLFLLRMLASGHNCFVFSHSCSCVYVL